MRRGSSSTSRRHAANEALRYRMEAGMGGTLEGRGREGVGWGPTHESIAPNFSSILGPGGIYFRARGTATCRRLKTSNS